MFDSPGNSLFIVIGLLALIAIIYGVRASLSFRNIAVDARADYDYKAQHNMIPKGISRERYIQIYRRVNNPRGSAYIAGGLALVLLLTPLLFWLLEWGLELMYNLSGQDRVIEPGYLVWQFTLYFVVMMVWALIGYLTASRYHRRTPGSLQFEIDRELYGEGELSDYDEGNFLSQPGPAIALGFLVTAGLVLYRLFFR